MNNLINQINNAVPTFSAEELSRNSYQIYYKPFTSYNPICQAKYSSRQVSKAGELINLT